MAEVKKEFTVLIADDEKMNVEILGGILSPMYNLLISRNGTRALELAKEHKPDVILLDVLMPDMSGFEVISKLKQSEDTSQIPVIFITGLTSVDDEEKGFMLGAVDYITKPFSSAIVKMRVLNQIKLINHMRLIVAKETAEKNNRAKREFLSRMSHEMRTPMNAVIGMTELAKNMDEATKRNNCLSKISAASSRLLQLIDDLLDMYAIENNKLRLVSLEFSFQALIQEVLAAVNPDIEEKRQKLAAVIDTSIPDILLGDKKRLAQIMLNLLSNATKFTPENGEIQVCAYARGTEEEALTIQIEVTDSGIGISKEQQETLFAPFEQADGGIDRKYTGAGLGLTISKHIVLAMGGEIWAESGQGKGAKFAFTFKARAKKPDGRETDKQVSLAGRTALLAEDVEVNREIFTAMLEDTGLQIICARDGREALALFTAEPEKFDIIIMDVNMPEMDGVEATRRIRTLGTPEGVRVPIVALTANVLEEEVDDYLAAGMNDHIGKPFEIGKLKNILNKYLG